MTASISSPGQTVVKAPGDLTGEAIGSLQDELCSAIAAHDSVLVDLARPTIVHGKALAMLLMARNSADASECPMTVRFNRAGWKEFRQISGLWEISQD